MRTSSDGCGFPLAPRTLARGTEVGEDEARDGDHQFAFPGVGRVPFGGVGRLFAFENGSERTAILMEQPGQFFCGNLVDGHDGCLWANEGQFSLLPLALDTDGRKDRIKGS